MSTSEVRSVIIPVDGHLLEVNYHVDRDPAYGADADGRRGIMLTEYIVESAQAVEEMSPDEERLLADKAILLFEEDPRRWVS